MPTPFSHAAIGFAITSAAAAAGIAGAPRTGRLLVAAAAVGCAADLDGLGMHLRLIPYGAPWGHRGMAHSLVAAAAYALVATLLLGRQAGASSGARIRAWELLFAIAATHPLMDMLTNGGMGIALFAPFTSRRFFFPVQPIPVSPMGLAFFTPRGFHVLAWEAAHLWPPAAALAALGLPIRKPFRAAVFALFAAGGAVAWFR